MRQIFSAVAYLHEHKIVHRYFSFDQNRDLKPENFLLKYENDEKSIKLIDFGLAKPFKEDEIMTQTNGTLFYMAPEILQGKYSFEVDYWYQESLNRKVLRCHPVCYDEWLSSLPWKKPQRNSPKHSEGHLHVL